VEESSPGKFANPGGIVGPASEEVWRQQNIDFQLVAKRRVGHLEPNAHKDDGTMGISQDVLDDAVPSKRVGIGELVKQAIPLGITHLVPQIPLFLVEETLAVRDQQLHVTSVRLIDSRIVDLVENPVA
jgi:hypothetical protein